MAKSISKKEVSNTPEYAVIVPFRDKNNFDKEYKVGEDVSHFEQERLEYLISIGHVASKVETETDDNDPA